MTDLFDVLAVSLITNKVRLIAENKTERNAEAIEMMAVGRRGVESEFFVAVPSGKYINGNDWVGIEGKDNGN